MKIAIASDHVGLELKKYIIDHLKEKGIRVKDFGPFTNERVDYPDYGLIVGKEVVKKKFDYGILICGTGIGISIAANKVPGIRAALCSDTFSAHATREHNDANILALGARVVARGLALDIVDVFLNGKFEGGRHTKRIKKISNIEEEFMIK
ncbi:ribose 5-phosphate isomerase B [Maledivibacter halophilus]|uniref:Ribose-5-phosphate isomerase n=1 Tax=Maledivibacter halophilus TaxID=36842 RepID=A0A1T5KDL3_9FIRM|nr:ribose 5-phosphate isomerase B [Maledivibacter halophilus]SKC61478.1 ribose-5-phosphate isomerase [Maledivibacter halophilus]